MCRARAVGLGTYVPVLVFKGGTCQDFWPNKRAQVDHLLHACELGDRKLTELLAEMRKQLGAKRSSVLKKLFMDRLSSSVRRVLVAGPIDNLDDVACRADCVLEGDRLPTSDPRFVAAPDKLFVEKVD